MCGMHFDSKVRDGWVAVQRRTTYFSRGDSRCADSIEAFFLDLHQNVCDDQRPQERAIARPRYDVSIRAIPIGCSITGKPPRNPSVQNPRNEKGGPKRVAFFCWIDEQYGASENGVAEMLSVFCWSTSSVQANCYETNRDRSERARFRNSCSIGWQRRSGDRAAGG